MFKMLWIAGKRKDERKNENEYWQCWIRCTLCSTVNPQRKFQSYVSGNSKWNMYSSLCRYPSISQVTVSHIRCHRFPPFIIIPFAVGSHIFAVSPSVHRFIYHFLSLCSLPGVFLERSVNGGKAPLIHKIDTTWKWVLHPVRFTPGEGARQYTWNMRLGGPPGSVWTLWRRDQSLVSAGNQRLN